MERWVALLFYVVFSLMGDAMSHAVLPGVALSFLFNIPMFIGALVTGMLASLFIGLLLKQ